MRVLLILILLYAVVQSLLIGMAVAVGLFLDWLVPGLDMGLGILVGMLSTIAAAYLFVQAIKFGHYLPLSELISEDDDEDDDDVVETRATAKTPHTQRRRSRRNR